MQEGEHIGPYQIQQIIGRGGMAEVYKAWHSDLHCFHAIKVPLFQVGDGNDPELLSRFLREARISANLRHHHIGTIHGVSTSDADQPYFAMEYIEGEDLADLLARGGKMSLQEALPIIRQIADALDYAHNKTYIDENGVQRKGIVHRDIKPNNILLENDGKGGYNVKIVDFGIARAQEESPGTRLTKAGMIVGTPEYMSPEQANTPDLVNKRSDLYSFAIIVYEMLCGHPPFQAQKNTSPISVLLKHAQEEPVAPIKETPELLLEANKAILKALAKNPLDRFGSCAEFVAALAPEKITTGKKHHWLPMGIGGAVLAGMLLIVFGLKKSPAPPPVCGPTTFPCPPPPPDPRIEKSKSAAIKAGNINDANNAARITLVADFQRGKISAQKARMENNKLNEMSKKAEALARDGLNLWSPNDNAWYQYYRAKYFQATTKEDYMKLLQDVKQAEKKFPHNTELLSLEASIKLDGKL